MSDLVCEYDAAGMALHHDWHALGHDDRGREVTECYFCHSIAIE